MAIVPDYFPEPFFPTFYQSFSSNVRQVRMRINSKTMRYSVLLAALFAGAWSASLAVAEEESSVTAARSLATDHYAIAPSEAPTTLASVLDNTAFQPVSVSGTSQPAQDPAADCAGPCAGNCCPDCGCCRCCKCGPPGDFWIRDEYLGWWASPGQTPVLVATSPDGTLPATVPLYGGDSYNGGYRSGNWVQGGMWFDCCHTHGITGDYFFVGQQNSPFFASSNGDPILTRPFIDARNGQPAEELIAFPGVITGGVGIQNFNSLQGAGISGICNLCCCDDCCCSKCWCQKDCRRLDFTYGFRFYNFEDNLYINEDLTAISPVVGVPIGTRIQLQDSFTTRSNFYGGEIGLIYQRWSGRWMREGTVKVALGAVNSVIRINGATTVSFPGQPTVTTEGGLLALSSNIGRYEENSFTAIPQFSYRLGYRITEQWTLLAGYTLIYFGEVARAGDQIDVVVNPNLIPPPVDGGPNRPAFHFNPSDLVLQGITLGAQFNF